MLKQVTVGHPTPAKKSVGGVLKSVEKTINKGNPPGITNNKTQIRISDAWELKRNVNELIRDPGTPKNAVNQLKIIANNLNKVIGQYGGKNPEFAKYFYEAEDIYRGLNKRSFINNFLQKHVSLESTLKNPLLKILFTGGAYKIGGIPGAAVGILGAVGLRESVKAIEFLYNSPTARKYYADIVKSSLARDVAAAKKAAINLNKTADNYQKKNEPESDYEFELESL